MKKEGCNFIPSMIYPNEINLFFLLIQLEQ